MSRREIQIVWRWGAAGLDLERIGAEGLKGFGISPEETEGDAILAAAEFAVPVGGELIVSELAGAAQDERAIVELAIGEARRSWHRGQKIASAAAAELVALEIEQGQRHGVDAVRPPLGKNVASRLAAERSAGITGMLVLMYVPGEAPLRWRVP